MKQKRMYCPNCGRYVLAVANRPSHLVHGVITGLLFAPWAIVWGLSTLTASQWWCPFCATITVDEEPKPKTKMDVGRAFALMLIGMFTALLGFVWLLLKLQN